MKKVIHTIEHSIFFFFILVGFFTLSTKPALALFPAFRAFAGRVVTTSTTPTINCYGATGDMTITKPFAMKNSQTSSLVILQGAKTYKPPSSGQWIIGLHLAGKIPLCTTGEYPFFEPYQ